MKSFKKIALAMVAAMTLGTLSVAPANAAVMTVETTLATVAKTATSVSAPVALPVPSDNKIDAADALKFVATVDTGTAVSVTATNATIVTALHSDAAPVSASSGSSSLAIATGTGTTATFYVYTKTTAVGTVVVTNQGTTLTYYVQGTAGAINTLAVSAPASGAAGTKQTVLVTATDIFGNKVSGKSITGRVFGSGGTLETTTATTGATLATFGVAEFKLTLPTASTRSLVEFSLTTAADGESADVVGLTARTLAPYAEITVRDLASELAAKESDLAAEKAARAADKVAADKALADAKLAAEAAAVKAAAELVTANAEIAKLKADAVIAKVAADKALADVTAELAKVKADNAATIASMKKAFNSLARKWNAKNPKAKVALVK
jgi:subtilase-type serine protease